MSNETQTMETAPTTTEGQAASQSTEAPATVADGQGQTQQQAPEGQTTEGQQADGAKTEGDQAKADDKTAVPEQYEFKAPDGREFDPGVIDAFSEVAKELSLPQDAAQKILDKVAPIIEARQVEQITALKTEWAETSKADKEFGGDKLNENLAVAKRAMDAFGTPELSTLLNESGLGNHPEIIRLMVRAGKAISEDGFVPGGRASPPSDPAKRMFPNQA